MKKLVLVVAFLSLAAEARAEIAAFGLISEGVAQDTSGIHRASGGALISFAKRFGVEAHLNLESWTRWSPNNGTSGYGGGLGMSVKAGLMKERMRGVTVGLGVEYLRFFEGGQRKRLEGSSFVGQVDPNVIALRAGLTYGFPSSEKTTISIRFDVSLYLLETTGGFPPEVRDPHPTPLAFHLGLEFMRWTGL
jgi:hypothetical protein